MASTIIPNWIILFFTLIITVVLIIVLSRRKKPSIFKESDSQFTNRPIRERSPEQDLRNRVKSAKDKIIVFGLSRKYYATYKMRNLLEEKSRDIPIRFYLMDPSSKSHKDRSRIEPFETTKEVSEQIDKETESAFRELLKRTDRSPAGTNLPGLSIYYYNFPCSYAIEMIDDVCRIKLYGHGKGRTGSPIMIYSDDSPDYDYFASQIKWIEQIASGKISPEWYDKKIKIEHFE